MLLLVLAPFLVLSGIACGLGITGYRKKSDIVMWFGVAILVVIIAVTAVEALFWIPCMLLSERV